MSQKQEDVSKPPRLSESELDKADVVRKQNQVKPKAAYKVGDKVTKRVKQLLPNGKTRELFADFYVAHRDTPEGESYWMYQLSERKDLTDPLYKCDGKSWFPETDLDDAEPDLDDAA